MAIKPIQTRVYGHRFRSRLEARWAVAFTSARIQWQYEPEGFDLGDQGLYLPDFWLPQVNMWAEVKPQCPTDDELAKAATLANQSGKPCLLLIGPPSAHSYWAVEPIDNNLLGDDWIVSCGGILTGSMDYCIFEGSNYHESESRFYANCGIIGEFPMPFNPGWDSSHPAVEAALSARFEHGECPQ